MRRKLVILVLFTALLCLCTYAGLVLREQRAIAAQVIRLHIVANSDSEADQTLKLQVRDALLPRLAELTDHCQSKTEAEAALQSALPELQALAMQVTAGHGNHERVSVTLTQEGFPRRDYDTFSLPAGQYSALRVELGSAKGHNWWCVIFPALCAPATGEELVEAAQTSGMSTEQTDLITGETVTVELKFRFLDWLRALFG